MKESQFKKHILKKAVKENIKFPIHEEKLISLKDDVKKVVLELQDIMENEIFCWKEFPVELPEFKLLSMGKSEVVSITDLFKSETFDELEMVSRGDNGNLKNLTPKNLKEIRAKGEFYVPSHYFEGKYHTWRLSRLLQKGWDNIVDSYRSTVALAIQNLIVSIPNRVVSRNVSVVEGLRWIGEGIVDIPEAVIGFPSYDLQYPNFVTERREYILKDLKEIGEEIYTTPDGLVLDFRHIKFMKDKEVIERLRYLVDKAQTDAKRSNQSLRTKILNDLMAKKEDTDLAQKLEDELVDYYNKKYLESVKNDKLLESKYPKFGEMLADYLKVLYIAARLRYNLNLQETRLRKQIRTDLKQKHPLLGRIDEWLDKKTEKELKGSDNKKKLIGKTFGKTFMTILQNEKNLDQYTYILSKTMEYKRIFKERMKHPTPRPRRIFTFHKIIWRPENWEVKHSNDYLGKPYYFANKCEDYVVTTMQFGWRIRNFFTRLYVWNSNALYWLIAVNLLNGPFSIKALFYRDPYYPAKYIDLDTGELKVDEGVKVETYSSRLRSLWNHIRKSRQDFESKPDTGFIGKSITRLFNKGWNYVFKGTLGSLIIGAGFPIVTFANAIVSIGASITSPVWIPISDFLLWVTNWIFYDFDTVPRRLGISRIVVSLFKILIAGGLQIVLSTVLAIGYHPLMAILLVLFAGIRSIFRLCYDWILYYIVIVRLARIPAKDSFLARRIEGPGLSSSYFYQINTDLALLALQLHMEKEHLNIYKESLLEIIQEPEKKFDSFDRDIFSNFAGTINHNHPSIKKVREKNEKIRNDLMDKINELYKKVPMEIANKEIIRQTENAQKETLGRGTLLVRSYYTDHIFIYMTEERKIKFWISNDLEENDWMGLTKVLFSKIFSPNFLVSLEESDNGFKIKVEHLNMERYLKDLFDGVPSDDLDSIIGKTSSLKKVTPSYIPIDPVLLQRDDDVFYKMKL